MIDFSIKLCFIPRFLHAIFQLYSIQEQSEGRRLDLHPFFITDCSRLWPAELTLFKALAEQAQTGSVEPDGLEQSARLVDK